jgi:hypothetical protein
MVQVSMVKSKCALMLEQLCFNASDAGHSAKNNDEAQVWKMEHVRKYALVANRGTRPLPRPFPPS